MGFLYRKELLIGKIEKKLHPSEKKALHYSFQKVTITHKLN